MSGPGAKFNLMSTDECSASMFDVYAAHFPDSIPQWSELMQPWQLGTQRFRE